MKNHIYLFITFLIAAQVAVSQTNTTWQEEHPPVWAYDPGPNFQPNTENDSAMAKELIDLYASIPYFPAVAKKIRTGGKKKFRPAYGPIPWRMVLEPNSVKILFIGQDGTHVAEAANRPATAGFGGRAQDLAAFFGVEYSAAFINTFAFTIKGQYSARFAPYTKNGKFETKGSITPNDVWLISQDQRSPIVKWRNNLIDWIIRNNKKSLKMIVLFGGSAKDSVATYIESRGGKVGSFNEKNMNEFQVPLFKMSYSGGNNEFPVPLNKSGGDLYKDFISDLDYADSRRGSSLQNKAMKFGKSNSEEFTSKMVFTKKGPYKNGLIHHAQLGGYDLSQIYVNDRENPTLSLKGLELTDGSKVKNDILVVALPHPTYLSNRLIDGQNQKIKEFYYEEKDEFYMETVFKTFKKEYMKRFGRNGFPSEYTPEEVARRWASTKTADKLPVAVTTGRGLKDYLDGIKKKHPNKSFAKSIHNKAYAEAILVVGDLVEKDVGKLRPYAENGWKIPEDPSHSSKRNVNTFALGEKYRYGRSDIHNVYYDFGTPKNRMVSKSSASRLRLSAAGLKKYSEYLIVFGSRDRPSYKKESLVKILNHKPNEHIDPDQTQ